MVQKKVFHRRTMKYYKNKRTGEKYGVGSYSNVRYGRNWRGKKIAKKSGYFHYHNSGGSFV